MLAAKNGRISYAGVERKRKEKQKRQILKDVLLKMSVNSHMHWMLEMAAVSPGGEKKLKSDIYLLTRKERERRSVAGFREAGFIIQTTLCRLPVRKTETGHLPSCFVALWGSRGFVSAGSLPIT